MEQINLYFYLYKCCEARRLKLSRYHHHINNFGRPFAELVFFFFSFSKSFHSNSFTEFYDDGTLKWKSQDKTNANTMQASKKFRKRWPCQKLCVSVTVAGAKTVTGAVALLVSFECCVNSMSFDPKTLRATELQISQVLKQSQENRNKYQIETMKLKDEIIKTSTK